jgi:hypothetical protein
LQVGCLGQFLSSTVWTARLLKPNLDELYAETRIGIGESFMGEWEMFPRIDIDKKIEEKKILNLTVK